MDLDEARIESLRRSKQIGELEKFINGSNKVDDGETKSDMKDNGLENKTD